MAAATEGETPPCAPKALGKATFTVTSSTVPSTADPRAVPMLRAVPWTPPDWRASRASTAEATMLFA